MLTPQRWQTLKTLFHAASDLLPEQRDAYVDAACPDTELALQLRKMLEQSSASCILDQPAASLAGATQPPVVQQAFSTGQVIDNRFVVVRFLGKGGMGEVYEAYDRELHEQVALKTVRGDSDDPSSMLNRLRQEVRRARRISHPNVCRVYDFFTHSTLEGPAISFLTMQLLAGPTLAEALRDHGPMNVTEAAPIARQILAGLAAAHDAGLIHRDLKPGNVMLIGFGTTESHAVVTDFGLASERSPQSFSTSAGGYQPLSGTPTYMAPEQFKGRATIASDIYAFGTLLFETLTGSTPDQADRRQECEPFSLPAAKSHEECLRGLSSNWRNVILRCLEIRPDDRFATAHDILAALDGEAVILGPVAGLSLTRRAWLAGGALATASAVAFLFWKYSNSNTAPASLIVLPVRETGGDADGRLLADGLTDGLIDSLSHRGRLRVIAHGSAFHYRDRKMDASALHRELDVTHVLSGQLEISGEAAHLSIFLLTAPQGERIWSKIYDRPLTSILAMQSEVSRDVASALNALGPGGRSNESTLSAADMEAYKLYLQGRYHWNLRSEAGFRQAAEYFREAIGIDPGNERAYCGLADSYALLAVYGFARPKDVMPQATVAAQRALAISGELAEAYTSLGLIQAVYDWDWLAARNNLLKALELDPGYVTGHQWYAYYLAWTGDQRRGREQMLKAQSLDPLSLALIHSLGWLAFWSLDYKLAESYFRRALALNPAFLAVYAPLAHCCAAQSRFQEALALMDAEQKLDTTPGAWPDLARLHALAGHRERALRFVADSERALKGRPSSGIIMAMAYEALQDREKAFGWLYEAYEDRSSQLVFLNVDPRLDGLRADPRFHDLLRKIHLRS